MKVVEYPRQFIFSLPSQLMVETQEEGDVVLDGLFQTRVAPILFGRKLLAKRRFFNALMKLAGHSVECGQVIRYSRNFGNPWVSRLKLQVIDAAVSAGLFVEFRSRKQSKLMTRLVPSEWFGESWLGKRWEEYNQNKAPVRSCCGEIPDRLMDWINQIQYCLYHKGVPSEIRLQELIEQTQTIKKFQRQACFVVSLKKKNVFFADFYFPEIDLAIEVDGKSHKKKKHKKADQRRDALLLEHFQITTIRFDNKQILDGSVPDQVVSLLR